MRSICVAMIALLALQGCDSQVKTKIYVDGSSTVFPITEAIAEEFGESHPGVDVLVGVSGTGGGFKKFIAHEIDINDASRPIKSSEHEKAVAQGIGYIELPVAYDGISVVVNKANSFVKELSVEQLQKLWGPESQIKRWSELDPSFPDTPIKLYGPGVDSGTFDYFTEAINGKSGSCRSDFTKSEDDNFLVRGVEGDKNALGFFGFAYYSENKEKLKVVPIRDKGAATAVAPTQATINNGTYAPLSRPVFIYVTTKAAARQEVKDFVNFYLDQAPKLTKEVGYVPLPAKVYELAKARFANAVEGSAFLGRETRGVALEELYVEPQTQR